VPPLSTVCGATSCTSWNKAATWRPSRPSTVPRAFILLPAVLGGKKVKVLTYLIDGTAPPLGGQHDAMAWLSLAKEGEHLLNLVEDKAVLVDKGEADAIYVPDDFENHIDHQNPLTLDAVFTLA